jgi:hypothetical protein
MIHVVTNPTIKETRIRRKDNDKREKKRRRKRRKKNHKLRETRLEIFAFSSSFSFFFSC